MHHGEPAGSRDAPFVLPLDRETFADALAKGKGRVFLHVEEHGATDFEDLIVGAALQHQAYDPQCEYGHGAWVGSLIEEASCEDLAEAALEHALEDEDDETDIFDADQRRGVLLHLARGGSARALQLIENHLRLDAEWSCLVGAVEFVALAGARAVIACSEILGNLLPDDPEQFVDGHIREFDFLIEQEGAARRIVEDAARNSAAVARFLSLMNSAEEEEETESRLDAEDEGPGFRPHLADLLQEFRAAGARGESVTLPEGWSSRLDDDERETILQEIVLTDPAEDGYLKSLLLAFVHRGPPRFDRRLLELVEHPTPGVARRAMNVLEQIQDPQIRARAIQLLEEGDLRRGLRLLTAQFEEADLELVRAKLVLPPDPDDLHALLMSLIGLFEVNPESEGADLLELAYEQTPCSNCRARAAEVLGRLGIVPDWMVEELVFDVSNREED